MKLLLPSIAVTVAFSLLTDGQTLPAGAEDVMKVDEAYRLAKLHQDIKALDQILADGFNETNQNGNSRDKAHTLELWKTFAISSLTTDTSEVRVTGDAAMVLGTQTENGSEHMFFTRVYVWRTGGWQLLSSMQFRNPNASTVRSAVLR